MLEATLTLLTEGGLGAVTVAAVATAAQTSNGSLYHRFGDRRGLLLAAQAHAFEQIQNETQDALALAEKALNDGATRESVATALSSAAFAIFTRHRGATLAFLIESNADAEHAARTEEFLHSLAAAVTAWMRAHLAATEDGAETAWRILLALGISRALLDDARVSPRALAPETVAATTGRAVLAALQE